MNFKQQKQKLLKKQDGQNPDITDLWFKTSQTLEQVADLFSVQKQSYDGKDSWEWVTGLLNGHKVNISRLRVQTATDIRIFLRSGLDEPAPIPSALIDEVGKVCAKTKLRPLMLGTWRSRGTEEFDKFIVRQNA